jgi:hypothetical protein
MDSKEQLFEVVWSVVRNGCRVGTVFGNNDRFHFLLDDRVAVDRPRGPFASVHEAQTACEHAAICLSMAERWDDERALMMLDT